MQVLALAVFFGGGLSTILATRAIFRAAESRKQAGTISGAVLRYYERMRWAALLLLAASQSWKSLIVLGALSIAQAFVDRRIRRLRDEIGGSTEGLDPADPRRQRFGALHGLSVSLLAIQTALAGADLWRG